MWKKKGLGKWLSSPEEINHLSSGGCMSWILEILGETEDDLDFAWTVNDKYEENERGYLLPCIQRFGRPKEPYAEVLHATVGKCCKNFIGRALVFCLRRRKGSDWAIVTSHTVGECPILHYSEPTEDEMYHHFNE